MVRLFSTRLLTARFSLMCGWKRDTVWLTQAQMAVLFGRERSVITKHIHCGTICYVATPSIAGTLI